MFEFYIFLFSPGIVPIVLIIPKMTPAYWGDKSRLLHILAEKLAPKKNIAITINATANVELHPAYPARTRKVPGNTVEISWLAFRKTVVDSTS